MPANEPVWPWQVHEFVKMAREGDPEGPFYLLALSKGLLPAKPHVREAADAALTMLGTPARATPEQQAATERDFRVQEAKFREKWQRFIHKLKVTRQIPLDA